MDTVGRERVGPTETITLKHIYYHVQGASLRAQLVRIHLQCRRPRVDFWVGKICWRRDRLPTLVFWGFLVAQLVKNLPVMWETCVPSLG